jgi:hypothetical protein
MPKVKNWTKEKTAKNEFSWKNDKTDRELIVSKSIQGGWTTTLVNKDGSAQGFVVRKQPTKEKARSKAVEWMRDHSDGMLRGSKV